MGMRSWNVKEQFCFPKSFGMPKGVKSLNVTPQYIHRQIEDTVEVQGIYHITCHVEFDNGEGVNYVPSDYTQIEDLEMQGEVGYFEYAVPMHEIMDDGFFHTSEPVVSVEKIESKKDNHGIEISWSVKMEYETSKLESSSRPAFFESSSSSSSSSSVEIFESSSHPIHEVVDEAPPMKRKEHGKIKVKETKVESPAFIDPELEFIHSLEDGYSKVVFLSNKVFGK